jgi:ferrochelatase
MDPTTLLLVNMGGPTGPDQVAPYLRAIFADPAILGLPQPLRALLGRFIVRRRTPKVRARYQLIGGGSPLAAWTHKQVARTEQALADAGSELRVRHAFRYTEPTIEQVMATEADSGTRRIVLLPLFPHHTDAMTGSIERVAQQAARDTGVELHVIGAWGERADVIALWGSMLDEGLVEAGQDARVLFVAHGIPQRQVRRGEDYPDRVRATARALAERLGRDDSTEWSVAFQSRVGPVRWTEPYLETELLRLGTRPAPVVLMPLSFVADCLETLYDLDHIAATELRQAGVERVVRVPAFNDAAAFGRLLATMATEAVAEAGRAS